MIRMRLAGRLSIACMRATLLSLSLLMIQDMLVNSARAMPSVINVSISGFAFNPQNITILRGDTVVWNNTDHVIHTLWFVEVTNRSTYLLSEPIFPGATWLHTFNYEVNLQYYSFDRLWTSGFITVMDDSKPPTTVHDYDGLWHTSDFTVQLTAVDDRSGVAGTYYKINDGQTLEIGTDGQPLISNESANTTLEYWSIDDAGNEEPHNILSGIRLDKTAPKIIEAIRQPFEEVLPGQSVKVSANITDATSGAKNATLFYTTDNGTSWADLPMTFNSTSGLYETIILGQLYCTWVKYEILAYDNAENNAVEDNAGEHYQYHVIPEVPTWISMMFLSMMLSVAITLYKKRLLKASTTN